MAGMPTQANPIARQRCADKDVSIGLEPQLAPGTNSVTSLVFLWFIAGQALVFLRLTWQLF